jgi:NADPH:quinone reductase-like Zn-dependent oxidoreductase
MGMPAAKSPSQCEARIEEKALKAITQDKYGWPDVLELSEVDKPIPKDDEVLVRVHSASVHPGDYFLMTGLPMIMRLGTGLRRPRKVTPGFDLAGLVEEVGKDVADFQRGDEVFGEANGSCAEFVTTAADKLALKPTNLSLAEAATVAVSGVTALRGIRDAGKVKPGQKVLINGASGGVGIYAVQIAKSLGAEVTGVCGTGNVDMVRSLGADHVIDYTQEDFTKGGSYDLVLDNVANRSFSDARRALAPTGKLIPNSGRSEGRWLGPMGRMAKSMLVSLFVRQQGRPYFAPIEKEHLLALKELVEAGEVKPVVANTYPLAETAAAIEAVGAGHVPGKVVISM